MTKYLRNIFILSGFLFSIFNPQILFAQDSIIELKKEALNLPNCKFYIDSVTDGRKIKGNLGVIKTGVWGNIVVYNLKDGISKLVYDFINGSLAKNTSMIPITMNIVEMQISKTITYLTKTGKAEVEAEFYRNINGEHVKIYDVKANKEEQETGVKINNEYRLRKAIEECLRSFNNSLYWKDN